MTNDDLLLELKEMKKCGISVSATAMSKAKTENLEQYEGMSVGAVADLFCDLY